MHDDLGHVGDFREMYLPRWAADTDAGKDPPCLIADRRPDATQTGLMLAIVNGIALLADLAQSRAQRFRLHDRAVGISREPEAITRSTVSAGWNARIALPTLVQ